MKRRQLLQSCAALPLSAAGTHLWAAPSTQTRLLLVFLRGGYDAANLLIPTSSQFYYEARPNIAVPRPGSDQASALPLNADWGLHPALRDSILPLYSAGQAAFVPFAGTHDVSRSHFETQDSVELGQPLEGSRNYRSGFLNRLASTLGSDSAMSFTDQLPLVMQGDLRVPNVALRSLAKPSLDARQSRIISTMYRDTPLKSQVDQGFSVRDEVLRELGAEMNKANRNAISAKGFELEAQRMATLMKDKYNIGFVDVGGWDTHVTQGGASGYLAGRLDELGRGLASFAREMKSAWRDTITIVVSEFGRTLRENGNRGTDHGHGTVYWVLGGGIRGGQVLGEQLPVRAGTLFQNRDYPVLNEYRSVLGGLFSRIYGLDAGQLEHIFPNAKASDLGLV